MYKFKKRFRKGGLKTVFTIMLAIILTLCMPLQSFAGYYCTLECYQVCGKIPNLAGQCSKDMECPTECTGHSVLVLNPAWEIETPSCTRSGKYQTEICNAVSTLGICHQRDKFEYVDPLGHTYGSWQYYDKNQHRRICTRCNGDESGGIQYENHQFKKEPIGYKDIGDKHITTYLYTCTTPGCGYTYTKDENEPHAYNAWTKDEFDDHTANRTCKLCGHQQNESINIEADPLDSWTTESGTIQGRSEFWNENKDITRECGTRQSIKSEKIESKNMDTGEIKTLSTTDFYTEEREGRYTYTYTYTDQSDHKMSASLGELNIDHSAPQINVKVTTGGTDSIGTKYTETINYTQKASTHGGATLTAETKWTNIAPTIVATATDYFKDTSIQGVGVHSVIIYDDEGYVVGAGSTSASYQLTPADEGTHTYTIVATDNLCRKAFTWSEMQLILTSTYESVYAGTGANASKKYKITDWISDYDLNHVTVTQVTTHFDCTASLIIGEEDLNPNLSVNSDDTYYLDLNTVYVEKNIITEYINDFCDNSLNYANDTSDLAKVVFTGYDKDDNSFLIASAIRNNADSWKITQDTTWSYYGSGFELTSCNRRYTAQELLNMEENTEKGTVTRSSSSMSNPMHVDLDPRYVEEADGSRTPANPVTEEMLTELLNLYEYYTITITDVAGNKAIKKIVPEYSELRSFHTTIDPSSYKDPLTGLLK